MELKMKSSKIKSKGREDHITIIFKNNRYSKSVMCWNIFLLENEGNCQNQH